MGRGNVRVTGLYEGLYYIDNDYYQVFRRTDTFADDEEGYVSTSLRSFY